MQTNKAPKKVDSTAVNIPQLWETISGFSKHHIGGPRLEQRGHQNPQRPYLLTECMVQRLRALNTPTVTLGDRVWDDFLTYFFTSVTIKNIILIVPF